MLPKLLTESLCSLV